MVLFLSTLLLEKGFYMLKISDTINVQVLQLPNDKNGRTAIVSANIIMTDGRVISDVCSISPRSPFVMPLEVLNIHIAMHVYQEHLC